MCHCLPVWKHLNSHCKAVNTFQNGQIVRLRVIGLGQLPSQSISIWWPGKETQQSASSSELHLNQQTSRVWGAQTHHTIIKELAVCVWAKKSCTWTYQTDYSWQPANSSAYRFHTTLTNRATSNREYVRLKAANITGEQAEAKKKERNCTTWVKSWIRKQKAREPFPVFFRVPTHAPIHLAEHCCLKSRWRGTTQQLGPQTFTNICQWPTFSQVYQDPCRHYPNIKTMFPLKLDKTYRM